jgi:transcriptional regulator with XRE-family HTH domain
MLHGDRLKLLRESKGYTHQRLAELLDLSISQIWRYESGKTDPTGDILARIARVFNVSVDYLLGITDEATPPGLIETGLSQKERNVITALRQGDNYQAIKMIIDEK